MNYPELRIIRRRRQERRRAVRPHARRARRAALRDQLALPTSQRRGSVLPRSHADRARKAFEKVTKTALPEREARSYRDRVAELEQQARAAAAEATDNSASEEPDVEPVDDVD